MASWAVRAGMMFCALSLSVFAAFDAHAACGDGVVDTGEQCDDLNTASGDGCSASCGHEVKVAFTVNAMQILERFCEHNPTGGQNCVPTDLPQNYTYYVDQVTIAGQALVMEPGLDVTPVGVCATDPNNFPASYSTLPPVALNNEFNCAHWVRPRLAARQGQQVFAEDCAAFTGSLNPATPGVGSPLIDDGVCLRPLWQFSRFVDPAQGPFEIAMQLSVAGRHCNELGGCPARTRLDLRRGPETTLRLTVAFDGGPHYFVPGDTEPNPRAVDGCLASNPDCFDPNQARAFFDLTFDGVQPACTEGHAACEAPPALTPEPGERGFPCMLSSPQWGCPVVVNTCDADGPCSVEQLAAQECVGQPTEGFQTCEAFSWSECTSVLINASEMASNNIDDNCDGFPDDEQCDGIDNNGNGQVDESIGSCLIRMALFPVCFQGSDADFEAQANEVKNLMLDKLKLSNCTQNTHWEVIPPSELNVSCAKQPCASDGFDAYASSVMSTFDGVTTGASGHVLGRSLEFDGLMGLTDRDLCDDTLGVSNRQVLWTEDATTALHEFGHNLGLFDEYCSTAAGGPTNCNWGPPPKLGQSCQQNADCTVTSPPGNSLSATCGPNGCETPVGWTPNWLGTDLLCSPEQDAGCCGNVFLGSRDDCDPNSQNYCCDGNIAEFGRCFMSAGGLDQHGFCSRCQQHLENPPNPRKIACWNQFKCGNLTIDPREGCDGSTLPAGTPAGVTCTAACALNTCGNGLVQPGEACDDGDADNDNGCSNTCTLNGTVTARPEECAATQARMDCSFRHIGNAPYMVSMNVSVGPPDNGLNHFEVDQLTFGSGRLSLGSAPVGGRYKFEVGDSAGSVFVEYADPSFSPDRGTSLANSTERYSSVPLSFRFPVPPTVSALSKLWVQASVDDGPPVRTTVNGDPPVAELLTPPQPLECGTPVTLGASASFDPDGDTLRYRWAPASLFDDPSRVDAIALLPLGETLVELTVSDGLDQDTQSVTLTVVDTLGPLFTLVPPDLTTSTCTNVSLGAALAEDACGGSVTITNNRPAKFNLGTTLVTWTAKDARGNTRTATQKVTVILGDDPACCPAGSKVILGTSNADTLNGTSGADCILGLGSQDTINGNGGNDVISGGQGDDRINGNAGNDSIFGGPGQDILNGNAGTDLLVGGDGDDDLFGGTENDTLLGGQGQDDLDGQDGNDLLNGNEGHDTLIGGNGSDTLSGAGGNDRCTGGAGTNVLEQCEFGAVNACNDSVVNGTQTDVDCGGACLGCAVGKTCAVGGDCLSNVCSSGVCQPLPGGIAVDLVIESDWGGGYCARLEVSNVGATTTIGWQTTIDLNGSTIYASSDATFSSTTGITRVVPTSGGDPAVEAGHTVTDVDFCANRSAPASGTLPSVLNAVGSY